MAENIGINFQLTGVDDLDRATKAFDGLSGALNAGKGSGQALNEMRQILVGLKGKSSALSDLRDAVNGLNKAAESLKTGFNSAIQDLSANMKTEFKSLKQQMMTQGTGLGSALGKGIGDGAKSELDKTEALVKQRASSIAAAAKKAATKEYESFVDKNAYKPVTSLADLNTLQRLKTSGATLAPDHAEALKQWKAQQAEIKLAFRAQQKSLRSALHTMMKQDFKDFPTLLSLYADSMRRNKGDIGKVTAELVLERDMLRGAMNSQLSLVIADQAAYAAKLRTARSSVAVATANPSGPFMLLNSQGIATGAMGGPKSAPPTSKAPPITAIPKGETAKLLAYTSGVKRLTGDMGDLHSAARGVASGFGMMWLTWGRLVPLLAGASISHSFMQTAKQGSEIAQTLATIEHVGGNTRKEMEGLTATLEHMGRTGIKGPQEVAEAMKTLSLAGLKADKISSVMQDVSNFAVAGTTDMQTAAQTLVGVSTAFKLGSTSFGYVSDIISKAAAESMSSVESFAEAMKTASVVNSQYGVTLKDTAVGIAMLSQVNIQGTSAGTAIRNFYKDISERTPKVSKAMKKLGVDFRDNVTGQMKDLPTIVKELDAALKGRNGRQEADILKNIASERGGKVLFEMLALFRQRAEGLGKDIPNMFAKMYEEITNNSIGFASLTAAKMSQTVANQFSSLKSVMQTELFGIYKSIEPQLYLVIQNLKAAFADPSIQGAVKTLVTSIANLALVLSQNVEPIMRLVLALGALKIAQMALIPLGQGVSKAAMAIAAAMNTQNIAAKAGIATSAVSSAMRAKELVGMTQTAVVAKRAYDSMGMPLGVAERAAGGLTTVAGNAATKLGGMASAAMLVGRAIPYVNIALTVGTLAWMAYSWWTNKSKDTSESFADASASGIQKALEDETKLLQRAIDLKKGNIAFSQAMVIASQEQAKAADMADSVTKVASVRGKIVDVNSNSEYRKSREAIDKRRAELTSPSVDKKSLNLGFMEDPVKAVAKRLAGLDAAEARLEDKYGVKALTKELQVAEATAKRRAAGIEKAQAENTAAKVVANALTEAENKANAPTMNTGVGTPEEPKLSKTKKELDDIKRKAEDYISSLEKMVEKTRNLTEVEKLREQVATKKLVLDDGQLKKAEALAAEVDNISAKERARLNTVKAQNDAYTTQMAALKGVQDMRLDQAGHGRGPKAAAEAQKGLGNSFVKQDAELKAHEEYRAKIAEIDAKAAGVRSRQDQIDAEQAQIYRDQDLKNAQNNYEVANTLQLADIARRKQNEADWQAGLLSGLEAYSESASNIYAQMSEMAGNAMKNMEDALVNFVKTGTLDLRAMVAGIAEDIIRMLAKMAIQFFIVTPMMKYLSEKMNMKNPADEASIQASKQTGKAIAENYAPAAAAASLATSGGNAFGAIAGILITHAFSKMMSGYAEGGYTGAGGKYQPAGIVHKGEGILTQEEIARLGGPAGFESLRSSIKSGSVDSAFGSSRSVAVPYNRGAAGSSAPAINNTTVNVIEDASRAGQTESSQGLNSEEVINVFVSNIRRGGEAASAIEATYALDRRGR